MKIKFYVTSSGRCPVEDFLCEQSGELKADFVDVVSLLESGKTLAMPLSRSLFSVHPGLHELRLKDRGGQARVFYFIKKGEAIYMLHAFRKKTQELPRREIEVALKRLRGI